MKADRGRRTSCPLAFASSCLAFNVPATTPRPDSTSAWPRDPALDPSRGISLRAWKFRGLRPRTTMGAVMDSVKTTFELLASVPYTLRCSTKCCCSSFRRPLFAVALLGLSLGQGGKGGFSSHSELQPPPANRVHGEIAFCIWALVLEGNQGE